MRILIPFVAATLQVMPTWVAAEAQIPSLESMLLVAAAAGQTDQVTALLDGGVNVESKNKHGATSLILAAVKGHSQVVQLLLQRGADVNAETNTGITSLIAAASGGHGDVVKLLLEKGADVSARDQKGRTALNIAEATGATEVYALLRVVDKSSGSALVPVPGMTGPASVPSALPTSPAHTEVIRQGDDPLGLTVRAEPSAKGKSVAYLPVGSKVMYEGEASNGWVKLSPPTLGGWVPQSYLGSHNPEASVIGVDNPEQCLRVRNGAGTNHEKIGCLPKGAKIKLNGTVQNGWAQIVEPMAGWVTVRQIGIGRRF